MPLQHLARRCRAALFLSFPLLTTPSLWLCRIAPVLRGFACPVALLPQWLCRSACPAPFAASLADSRGDSRCVFATLLQANAFSLHSQWLSVPCECVFLSTEVSYDKSPSSTTRLHRSHTRAVHHSVRTVFLRIQTQRRLRQSSLRRTARFRIVS